MRQVYAGAAGAAWGGAEEFETEGHSSILREQGTWVRVGELAYSGFLCDARGGVSRC
jgi:hypothetical protein